MKSIRLIRQIRLNDFEAYALKGDFYGENICYMLIADAKRKGTLDDFPQLKGIEDEEGFERSNFIKVIFLHKGQIKKTFENELVSIAGGLLEDKDDCHWNCSFDKIESEKFIQISESRLYMFECFNIFLKKYGIKNKINNIKEEKFNFLSQD